MYYGLIIPEYFFPKRFPPYWPESHHKESNTFRYASWSCVCSLEIKEKKRMLRRKHYSGIGCFETCRWGKGLIFLLYNCRRWSEGNVYERVYGSKLFGSYFRVVISYFCTNSLKCLSQRWVRRYNVCPVFEGQLGRWITEDLEPR